MQYSDLPVVCRERSHLCLCWINLPLPLREVLQGLIRSLQCHLPQVAGRTKGLEVERSEFCVVTHCLAVLSPGQGPALAAEPHKIQLWNHVYCTKEFLICSFPKHKRTRFPLLMELCHYFQRHRGDVGGGGGRARGRGTQKDIFCLKLQFLSGNWGGRSIMLMG